MRPQAALRLEEVGLQVGALAWPLTKAVPLSYAMNLQPLSGKATPARLSGEASLSTEQLTAKAQWQDLALEWLAPYVQAHAPVQLRGLLAGRAELALARPLEAEPEARLKLGLRDLLLNRLALSAPGRGEPSLNLAAISLDVLDLDPAARSVQLGELKLDRPVLQLTRAGDGVWAHQALLPAATAGEGAASTTPWTLQLRGLSLDGGRLTLRDALGANLAAEQLRLRLQNLAWPARSGAMPAQLSFKLGALQGAPAGQGSLQWQGQLGLAPLAASGRLLLQDLPLQLLDPYLDPAWGLHLQQARLGLRSEFSARQQPQGWQAQLSGDLRMADLRLRQARQIEGQRVIGEELLSWQGLQLDGIKLALAPELSPQLEVADARLDDFYARLIVDEQGRFNLRDLGPQESRPQPEAVAVAAPPLRVAIGQTRVSKGQVDFSDRFIRPNYSARLSDLQGSLGAFASGRARDGAPEPARPGRRHRPLGDRGSDEPQRRTAGHGHQGLGQRHRTGAAVPLCRQVRRLCD